MHGFKACSRFNLTWAVVSPEDQHFIKPDDEGYPSGVIDTYYLEAILFESIR